MEVDMKLDHKEMALKYDIDFCPLSSSLGHQVSIEFILEDEGTWVIDPCDDNMTRPIDEDTVANAIAMVFDPNGPNGCWVYEARSCLYTMNVEPIFQDRILDDLQAYIDEVLTKIPPHENNNNQLFIIEFTVTIKYYSVNRARGIYGFKMGDIDLDRRPVDDDWVWVVDWLSDEYDETAWGMAVDALEKVDNLALVDGSECAVCIQELLPKSESVVKLRWCNHAFHEGCISEWFKKQASCPLCRSVTSQFA